MNNVIAALVDLLGGELHIPADLLKNEVGALEIATDPETSDMRLSLPDGWRRASPEQTATIGMTVAMRAIGNGMNTTLSLVPTDEEGNVLGLFLATPDPALAYKVKELLDAANGDEVSRSELEVQDAGGDDEG